MIPAHHVFFVNLVGRAGRNPFRHRLVPVPDLNLRCYVPSFRGRRNGAAAIWRMMENHHAKWCKSISLATKPARFVDIARPKRSGFGAGSRHVGASAPRKEDHDRQIRTPLGAGRIGKVHARAIRGDSRAELAAVADALPAEQPRACRRTRMRGLLDRRHSGRSRH